MVQTSQNVRHGQFLQEFMWHGPVGVCLATVRSRCKCHMHSTC